MVANKATNENLKDRHFKKREDAASQEISYLLCFIS